jgi:Holliday junction resolvasome RuvABC endonuclease subunit
MKPRLLAIDFGRDTGVARNYPFIETRCVRVDSATAFVDALIEAIVIVRPDAIVYEDVKRHLSTAAAHAWGGYRALTELCADRHGLLTVGVGVKVWKKHITGNGNAAKNDVMDALKQRGYDVPDHNAADALGLLLYALECGVVIVTTPDKGKGE